MLALSKIVNEKEIEFDLASSIQLELVELSDCFLRATGFAMFFCSLAGPRVVVARIRENDVDKWACELGDEKCSQGSERKRLLI